MTESSWNARKHDWIPSPDDQAFVESLMGRVLEPGKFANWIAPPVRGIKGMPIDFEYVRFN
jgi:benzoyl-CoA 2,3-dioxygenase component B